MQILVVINQKGGCGKTTSAISLAGILAGRGKKTLLVDLDPQSHCAAGLAIPEQRIDLDIGDAMLADTPVDPTRLLWRVTRGLDLAPSRLKLAGLEAARGGLASKPDKERRLARVLDRFKDEYDACLVDCSPSVGLLTYNALACATRVLVPVETSFFSLQGATKQVNTIRSLEKRLGVSAPYMILPTIHEPESALAQDLIGELHRRFGGTVCPTAIRRDVKLKEAASFGQPISEYAPESTGAQDYEAAAAWIFGEPSATAQRTLPETKSSVGAPRPTRPDQPAAVPPTSEVPGVREPKVETAPATRQATTGLARKLGHTPPTTEPMFEGELTTAPVMGTSAVRLVDDAEEAAREPVLGTMVLAPEVKAKADAVAGKVVPPIPAPTPARREPGVHPDGEGVVLIQPLTMGESLRAAGDFNHWSENTHVFRRNEELGVFELRLPLISGRYRYRLVVDGRWCCDPYNTCREPNEFGDFNSVLIVE